MLGDIVISVETAARQAEERGHALLDEIRILMVGLGIFVLFSIFFFFQVFSILLPGSLFSYDYLQISCAAAFPFHIYYFL